MDKQTKGFIRDVMGFADWINQTPDPSIIYTALHKVQSITPPRPLIGLGYMMMGEYKSWVNGKGEDYPCRNGTIRMGSSHMGNRTEVPTSELGYWVVAVDVTGVEKYAHCFNKQLIHTRVVRQAIKMKEAFSKMIAVCANQGDSSVYRRKAALLELCSVVIEDLKLDQGPHEETLSIAEDVLRLIHTSYTDETLGLEDIADEIGVSVRHLNRSFQSLKSIPVMKYLRQIRMEQAASLLTTSNLPIKDVAMAVGFKDPLHFSRLFKNAYGVAPSEFV